MSTDPHAVAPPDWDAAGASLRWITRPTVVSGVDEGVDVEGGELNLCFNAVDRHVVAGRSEETAVVVDVSGRVTTWTYAALLERTATLGGALRILGAGPGVPVLVRLDRGAEAVVALLACLRVGATAHLLDPAGDADELVAALEGLRPPVLVTAPDTDRWHPVLDRASHDVPTVVVTQAEPGTELVEPRDLTWELLARAGRDDPAGCERLAGSAPAYAVLVGGTWEVAPTATLALAAAQQGASLGLHPGQVWWPGLAPASSPGVVWGVLAPLLSGATLVVSDVAPGDDGAQAVGAAHHVTGRVGPVSRDADGVRLEVSAPGDPGDPGDPGGPGRSVHWRDGAVLPG